MAEEIKIAINAEDRASSVIDDVRGKFTSLAGVAAAMAAAGGGIFALVNKVAGLGEQLKVASEKTGISVESLSTLKFGAEQTNASFDVFTRSMFMFNMRIGTAATKSGEAMQAFDDLGVKVRDSRGQIRPTYDLLLDVSDALSELDSDAERANLSQQLFGRGVQDLAPLLFGGSRAILDLQQKAAGLGLEMSTKTAVASDDFKDSLDALKGAVTGLATSVSADMIPVLTTGIQHVTDWIVKIKEATTFDPARQADARKLVAVTDEQARAAQDAATEFGLFGYRLAAVGTSVLTVKQRTVDLSGVTGSMTQTVSAAADATGSYAATMTSARTQSETTARTVRTSLAPAVETVTRAFLDYDDQIVALQAHVDDTTASEEALRAELEKPFEMPPLPEPPRETFSGFLRSFAGAITDPAGKDVIQTALINAFTNLSQGGSFKSAIGAVGVAIGAAVGGPVGAAIAGFVTRGIFAGSTFARQRYAGITEEAVSAVEQGGIGMLVSPTLVAQQRQYRRATGRAGAAAAQRAAVEQLAGELRGQIKSLTVGESIDIATRMLEDRIYGESGNVINTIIRAALVREAVESGRASMFRAGISEQAQAVLAGTAQAPAEHIEGSRAASIETAAPAPPPPAQKSASLGAAVDAFRRGALSLYLDALAPAGSGLWNNFRDYFVDAFSGRQNQAALSYLTSQGWAISAQGGLIRVPGSSSAGVLGVLHGGEMVIPAQQAERVRSGDMAGGVTVNFYLQSSSDREIVAMIREQLPMIERSVSEGIRKGARFGTQNFDERMIRTVLQS